MHKVIKFADTFDRQLKDVRSSRIAMLAGKSINEAPACLSRERMLIA